MSPIQPDCAVQFLTSLLWPWQRPAPSDVLHVLVRTCDPSPQLALHPDHSLHSVQPSSRRKTTACNDHHQTKPASCLPIKVGSLCSLDLRQKRFNRFQLSDEQAFHLLSSSCLQVRRPHPFPNGFWTVHFTRTKNEYNEYKCSAVAEMGDRLATIEDMGRKLGAVSLFWRGEMGPHLTQCGLGRCLYPYQVASWSIQPFGHNRHGPKSGGLFPFGKGELGPHLTQYDRGRGLPAWHVSSWSIQPFGHNTPTSQTGQDRHRANRFTNGRPINENDYIWNTNLGKQQMPRCSPLHNLKACFVVPRLLPWIQVGFPSEAMVASINFGEVFYQMCRELKAGTQYPCSRAVNTTREHGCHFGHPSCK